MPMRFGTLTDVGTSIIWLGLGLAQVHRYVYNMVVAVAIVTSMAEAGAGLQHTVKHAVTDTRACS